MEPSTAIPAWPSPAQAHLLVRCRASGPTATLRHVNNRKLPAKPSQKSTGFLSESTSTSACLVDQRHARDTNGVALFVDHWQNRSSWNLGPDKHAAAVPSPAVAIRNGHVEHVSVIAVEVRSVAPALDDELVRQVVGQRSSAASTKLRPLKISTGRRRSSSAP